MKALLKRTFLASFVVVGAQVSVATAMPIESTITGADMVGIEVEAFYNGGSEVATWAATEADPSVAEGEGFAGAAAGNGWSLSQRGFTLGNVSIFDGSTLGLWTLSNETGFDFFGFIVRGLPGSIVFDDSEPGGDEGTPGSGTGRAFDPEPGSPATSFVYTDLVSGPDLYGTLNVEFTNGMASDSAFSFLADTDAFTTVPVPNPGTGLLLGAGLLLARVRRRGQA